ncbi:Methyl-CpG-binding domain protein 4 [Ranunculus cassubicifolius]
MKKMKVGGSPSPAQPSSSKKSRSTPITMYTVQCNKCLKWRMVSTQEEYEEIRKNLTQDPWYCSKKADGTCEDPAELEYDNSRTWVIDKPNIPKTPVGFKRDLVVRSDYSRCDLYYHLPTGSKVRSLHELEQFFEANPKYKSMMNLSDFDFTRPKVMEDTIPRVDGSPGKRIKTGKIAE